MRVSLPTCLGLALLVTGPSCVLAISNASVQRKDGTGYAYTAKRHGSDIDLSVSSLPDAVTGPGVLSATASFFFDNNDNGKLDPEELIEAFPLEFETAQRRVKWDDVPLARSVIRQSDLMIEFTVNGRDRSVSRIVEVIGPFDD